MRFENLNLADTASVTCRVASGSTNAVIEFHAGSPQGDLLATLAVKPTGGWDKWVELSAPLESPRPSHCRLAYVYQSEHESIAESGLG